MAANITRNVDHPVFSPRPQFWVRATEHIEGRRGRIASGDFVLIDPGRAPETGYLVLRGNSLETWAAQPYEGCAEGRFSPEPEGVAVLISSEVV